MHIFKPTKFWKVAEFESAVYGNNWSSWTSIQKENKCSKLSDQISEMLNQWIVHSIEVSHASSHLQRPCFWCQTHSPWQTPNRKMLACHLLNNAWNVVWKAKSFTSYVIHCQTGTGDPLIRLYPLHWASPLLLLLARMCIHRKDTIIDAKHFCNFLLNSFQLNNWIIVNRLNCSFSLAALSAGALRWPECPKICAVITRRWQININQLHKYLWRY